MPDAHSASSVPFSRSVSIGCQNPRCLKTVSLIARRKPAHRLALPYALVPVDQVEGGRLQHKESAIDESSIALRLFAEALYPGPRDLQGAKTAGGKDPGQRRQALHPLMVLDQLADVHVRDPVAIGEAERTLVQIAADPLQPAARLRVVAGVDDRHTPGLRVLLVDVESVGRHVEGDIGVVKEVIGEVLLDHVPLLPHADDEIVDVVG